MTMKMIIARIEPEEDELLCDLYFRLKESTDNFTKNHQDVAITLEELKDENCVLMKSIKLGESVN